MTLQEFTTQLIRLCQEGHGDLPVYYHHGASGDCVELSHAYVTNEIEATGPFDLDEGDSYISIYGGN